MFPCVGNKGPNRSVWPLFSVLCLLITAAHTVPVKQHHETHGITARTTALPASTNGLARSGTRQSGTEGVAQAPPTSGHKYDLRNSSTYQNRSGEPYEGAGDGPIDHTGLSQGSAVTFADGQTDPPKGPGFNEWPNNPFRYRKRSLMAVTTMPPTPSNQTAPNIMHIQEDMSVGPDGCLNTSDTPLVSIIHYVHILGHEPCTSHAFEEVVELFGTLEDSPYLIWAMAVCVIVLWFAIALKLVVPPFLWTPVDVASFTARSGFAMFAFLYMALGLVVVTQHHPNLVWLPTAITALLIFICVCLRVALAIRGRTLKALLPNVNAVLTSSQFDSPMTTYTPIPHHTAGVFDMESGIFYCMGSKTKAHSIPGGFSCKTTTGKYDYAGSTVSADSASPNLKVVLYSRSAKFMPSGVVSAMHAIKGLTQSKKPKDPEVTLYSRLMAEAEDM